MTVSIERNGRTRTFEYLTSEHQNGRISVHGWSKYPKHSVLAGQPMKCFIDSFNTPEEAAQAYPQAKPSHKLMQPQNSFDHLPDTPDC